jgi:hypothetical protein
MKRKVSTNGDSSAPESKSYHVLICGSDIAKEQNRRYGVQLAAHISLLRHCRVPVSHIKCLIADTKSNFNVDEFISGNHLLSENKNARPFVSDLETSEIQTASNPKRLGRLLTNNIFGSEITEHDFIIIRVFGHGSNTGALSWNTHTLHPREIIRSLSTYPHKHIYFSYGVCHGRLSVTNMKERDKLSEKVTAVTATFKETYTEYYDHNEELPDGYCELSLFALADIVDIGNNTVSEYHETLKKHYVANVTTNSTKEPALGIHELNFACFNESSIENRKICDILGIDHEKAVEWIDSHVVDKNMNQRCQKLLDAFREDHRICDNLNSDSVIGPKTMLIPCSEYDELIVYTNRKMQREEDGIIKDGLRLQLYNQIKQRNIQKIYLYAVLDAGGWLKSYLTTGQRTSMAYQLQSHALLLLEVAIKYDFLVLDNMRVENYDDMLVHLAELNVDENAFETVVVNVITKNKGYPYIKAPSTLSTLEQSKLYMFAVLEEGGWMKHWVEQNEFTTNTYEDEIRSSEMEFLIQGEIFDQECCDKLIQGVQNVYINLYNQHVPVSKVRDVMERVKNTYL